MRWPRRPPGRPLEPIPMVRSSQSSLKAPCRGRKRPFSALLAVVASPHGRLDPHFDPYVVKCMIGGHRTRGLYLLVWIPYIQPNRGVVVWWQGISAKKMWCKCPFLVFRGVEHHIFRPHTEGSKQSNGPFEPSTAGHGLEGAS